MNDAINPDHYKLTLEDGTQIECIDVIEALGLGFHLGNALKYAWRLGRKHDRLAEEIAKTRWYLDRWHERVWMPNVRGSLSAMLFAELRKVSTLFLGQRHVSVANDHEQLVGNLRGFCMVAEQHIESGKAFDSMPYMAELVVLFDLEAVLCGGS